MSSLDKDLNEKFGKSNRKLKAAYHVFDLENNSLHGYDVVSGQSYWDGIGSRKKFSRHIDENGHILEHDAANPDVKASTESPYASNVSEATQDDFDALIKRLKCLTQTEKEIIQLLWEGKTETEAGIILDMKRSTVATHLERARKKIKRV